MLSFVANLFDRHWWYVFALVVLLTILAGLGYLGDSFSLRLGDAKAEPRDNSDRQLRDEIDKQFSLDRNEGLLVIDGEDLFTRDNILAIRAAQRAVEELQQVDSVIWLDDLPTLNLFGLTEPLLPRHDAADEEYAAARQRVLENPLVRGQLMSDDSTTALLPIRYEWIHVSEDQDCTDAIRDAAQAELDGVAGHGVLRARMTGMVPLFVATKNAFDSNQRKFQIIGYVLVISLALFLFRGWAAVVVACSAPFMGILWCDGLLDFFRFERNGLTNVVMPVLITMVGMTDGIHMLVHIRRNRATGHSPLDAVQTAIREVGPACALTSLTTAIGFGSLLLAETEFIRNFGKGCGFAVIISFVAVMTVIPLLCTTWLGGIVHHGQEKDIVGQSMERFSPIIDWLIPNARRVSWSAIGLSVLLTIIALTLRPDAKTRDGLPDHMEAAQALMHCDEKIGGIDFARVVVQWPESTRNDSATILAVVQRVEQLIHGEKMLSHPLSINNYVTALAPEDAEVDERMSLLELVPPPLREVVFNPRDHRTLVNMRTQDLGVNKYRPVFKRLRHSIAELSEEYPGFTFELTGDPIVNGNELSQIVYDLAASLGTACFVIMSVMGLAYRSVRLGLISVIPNMLPLLVTASVLVVSGSALSFTSVCAFTVCIGIAVDDTIHFLTAFQREQRRGLTVGEAIRNAFLSVGTALVTTTLVLVTGFATVLISELPSHRVFGCMACCTIGAALVADLIVLPAMLSYFGSARGL